MSPEFLMITGSVNAPLGYVPESKGDGLVVWSFDPSNGKLRSLSAFADITNPTFVIADAKTNSVFASSEIDGPVTGTVASFSIDRQSFTLRKISELDSAGDATASLSFDRTGTIVLASNYSGTPRHDFTSAALASFRIGPDGVLAPLSILPALDGSGPNKARQTQSHPHQIKQLATGDCLALVDLGADQLVILAIDPAGQMVMEATTHFSPGSGPRHVAFHPDGRHGFVALELADGIAVIKKHAEGMAFDVVSEIRMPSSGQPSYPSEIALSPDGRFVLMARRGADVISLFAIAHTDFSLHHRGDVRTGGAFPRHFAFDPTGRWVLVANQNSHTITILEWDTEAGLLTPRPDLKIATGCPMTIAWL